MADISLITGNLTILGSTSLSGSAYLPSGYTNNPFVPSSPNQRYLLSNGTESSIPFAPGGVYATGFKFGWTFSNEVDLNRHINTQRWYIVTGSTLTGRIQGNNTIQINKTGIIIPFPVPNPPGFYSQGVLTNYTIEERFNHIEQSGVFALQSGQKIGFGTFDPQEKIHLSGGNLRVDNTGFFNNIYLGGQRLNINTDTVNLTGNQTIFGIKNYISRPTVNDTGVLLIGEGPILPENLVYTTGNQDIYGEKRFAQIPKYYQTELALSNNVVNLDENQTIFGIKSFSQMPNFYGTDFATIDQVVNLYDDQNIYGNKNFYNTPTARGNQLAVAIETVDIFNDQNIAGIKNFTSALQVNDIPVLLSGEVNQDNIVYTEGDQNISGLKNFKTLPKVNGTGVLLFGQGQPSPVQIYNNGVSQGTAASLNFNGGGISVSTVGSIATISATSNTQVSTIPKSGSAAGISGSFSFDKDYIYYCRANNDWVRSPLSKW